MRLGQVASDQIEPGLVGLTAVERPCQKVAGLSLAGLGSGWV